MTAVSASMGLAGGAGVPPGYSAVAKIGFLHEASMGAALDSAGPVLVDIANLTTVQPDLLIGSKL